MTNIYFEELMAEFHCHVVRNMAFGAVNGYPYSAELSSQGDAPSFLFSFWLDSSPSPALPALKEDKMEYVRWCADGKSLVAFVDLPSDFYAKATIRGLLSVASKTLQAGGGAPPHICPLCHNPGCDTYACLEEHYRETHAACLENRLGLPEDDIKKTAIIHGNYFTGALGAVFGALIGGVPIWALAISREQLYAAFFAFIPILSALLYRLFRGKARRNFAGIVVLLSSALVAFLLEQVWYWLELGASLGYSVSFMQSFAAYFRYHTLGSALFDMLFQLVFLIVGFFPAAILLRQYTARGQEKPRIIRGAKYVRETAMPIHTGDEPDPPEPSPAEEGGS